MADDLTRPFIGYRSAGRRPETQQDRRASADAPLAALRGMVSGVLGAPGDIESLVRMLPGLSEQTVLPTSEDVERRLPLRSASETPVGRAATGLSQLAGGFYTGPGSPLRAMAAMPSAVRRAGADFAMAAGQPAVNVVKPKGGNWLSGSVERTVDEMKMPLVELNPHVYRPETVAQTQAVDKWLDQKLAKYIKNEMATPEDPIRALAERGIIHSEITPTGYNVSRARREGGFPEEGMGVSDLAKTWEARADTFVNPLRASDMTSGYYPEAVEANPWLLKVPPETPVYEMLSGSEGNIGLGFGHLVDELRNAINPASGLPENLRWKYSDLDKVTVPQAVERVAKINEWRAAQKAEADMARAMNPATQVVKEYPDQGFKWVELRKPERPPEGWETSSVKDMYYDPTGQLVYDPNIKALEDALKYEGETMGHCVGGYCPDVVSGQSRIYSLRDKKGQPHVTIEVQPRPIQTWDDVTAAVGKEQAAKLWQEFDEIGGNNMSDVGAGFDMFIRNKGIEPAQEIVQIKGKANRAPKEEYLPAVQDFIRSGKWSNVGDLQNTGLIGYKGEYRLPEEFLYRTDEGGWEPLVDVAKRSFPDSPEKQRSFYRGASQLENDIMLKPQDEGFAEGGLVDGANFHTGDFDPARIDSIVGELHAMNAV